MRGRTGEGRGGGGGCTRRCRYRSMPNVSGFARVSSQCTQRRPISTRHDRVHHVERAGDCSCGGRGCAGGGGEGRKVGAGTKTIIRRSRRSRSRTKDRPHEHRRGAEGADRQARPGASTQLVRGVDVSSCRWDATAEGAFTADGQRAPREADAAAPRLRREAVRNGERPRRSRPPDGAARGLPRHALGTKLTGKGEGDAGKRRTARTATRKRQWR